jgi:hypothetical protein
LKVAVEGSVVKSSPAVGVDDVKISVAFEDLFEAFCFFWLAEIG